MSQLLIVESSSTEALRARLILERAGHQVALASEEQEALKQASENRPDLILLSALTPRLNGYATCGKLRLDPKTNSIPVVMLGTAEELDGLPSGTELGCLLPKPYDAQGLVTRIEQMLNGHSATASPAEPGEKGSGSKKQVDDARLTRGQFLANISHELRTPLHEINGMMELVLGTDLSQEQRGYLNTLQGSANALLSLIGDLIEFSELEAGQLDLEIKEFQLADLMERVSEVHRPRAADKGVTFSTMLSSNVPQTCEGDAKRLRQILMQLVVNAIKFTDHGEIVLSARRSAEDGQSATQSWIRFSVRDTGIGIPVDQQSVIFEPFQQADISSTRRYGGSGIGLAMSKQLVEKMGGRIWVESQPGQGSNFQFSVPLKVIQEPVAAPAPTTKSAMRPLSILVAEDSPTNQLIAKMSLSKAGHTVTLAINGLEAVKAFEGSKAKPFDLCLMDVSMPEMDGLQATQLIREKEKVVGGHLLIVAMTAFATKEYQIKCAEAGMDAYVTKPVRMDELGRVVGPLLASPAPAVADPPAATTSSAPPASPPPAPAAPPEQAVELEQALEVVGGDVDILKEAAEISLSEIPDQVTALQQAVQRADAKGVEAKAHRLKGIMGNLGGMTARKIAQQLETMGSHGELAGADNLRQALEQKIEQVKAFYADPAWEVRARELQESMDA